MFLKIMFYLTPLFSYRGQSIGKRSVSQRHTIHNRKLTRLSARLVSIRLYRSTLPQEASPPCVWRASSAGTNFRHGTTGGSHGMPLDFGGKNLQIQLGFLPVVSYTSHTEAFSHWFINPPRW
jgi:hypothetical protein